jgi:heat shock protein HtpX
MWEQIRSNRIRSVILVAALALVLLLLGYFLGAAFLGSGLYGLIIALVIWVIMNLLTYFQGDSIILAVSGAKKIGPDDHPRLWNVVEEMKIASGLPKMPDVYIIDDPAMNAFATGRDPNHAAVTVTSGLLQKMNRDELQGVVAHEMSHIKNRDILLMTLCSVLLGTIVILAWYGSRVMILSGGGGRRRSGSGGGNGAGIIIIVALVLAILAPIFAQLIYFAISRKREYLADASGALYTRYPEGLASALERIADSTVGLKSANQAFAPMYIANPFRKEGRAASDLTSTHPPIRERIRILRSMAGGASFADYNQAFQKVSNKKGGVIPASALAGAGLVSTRQPAPAADKASEMQDKLDRAREVSGTLDKLHQYTALSCQCGTAFRVPPDYKGKIIRCPRCGKDNQIPNR